MRILTLTGGRCIYYLWNNLATRRKMFTNSCHFAWDVYFSVFSGSMSLLLHLELNLKQHFRCGRQNVQKLGNVPWGLSWGYFPVLVGCWGIFDNTRAKLFRCWFKICIWLVGKEAEFLGPRTQRNIAKQSNPGKVSTLSCKLLYQ